MGHSDCPHTTCYQGRPGDRCQALGRVDKVVRPCLAAVPTTRPIQPTIQQYSTKTCCIALYSALASSRARCMAIQQYSTMQRYTALYSIQLYSAIHHTTLYTPPLSECGRAREQQQHDGKRSGPSDARAQHYDVRRVCDEPAMCNGLNHSRWLPGPAETERRRARLPEPRPGVLGCSGVDRRHQKRGVQREKAATSPCRSTTASSTSPDQKAHHAIGSGPFWD